MEKLKRIQGYKMLTKFVETYWIEKDILACKKPDIEFFVSKHIDDKQEQVKNILALFYFRYWHKKHLRKPPRARDVFRFIHEYNSQLNLERAAQTKKDVMIYRMQSRAAATYQFSTISFS